MFTKEQPGAAISIAAPFIYCIFLILHMKCDFIRQIDRKKCFCLYVT